MVFILRNRGYSVENEPSASARMASANAPPTLTPKGVSDISAALNMLLADVITLYLKTKNFHWHMSGPHFRDYHLLLDEQAAHLFTITDPIAERVRKVGGTTLHSIGHINRLQRILDNDAELVTAADMLAELRDDNKQLIAQMREAHDLCEEQGDVATTSLLENWIDEAEGRAWFLLETGRGE
jgi:starvation-inducible DNA-binding protein